jgi:cysteine desulfurase
MSAPRTYLDWNATAPLRPEARAAMIAALDMVGNASSVHTEGRAARAIVDRAREQVAALVGAEPQEVVFTSGATEANNWIVRAGWDRILVGSIEHDSVLVPARQCGAEIVELACLPSGRIDVAGACTAGVLESKHGVLATMQLANSETGALQPLDALLARVADHAIVVHCDAVQAVGRVPVAFEGVDLMSLSSHKLGGPTGVGALIIRKSFELSAMISGGGQERRRRAGTDNVAAIAGFGAAAVAARAGLAQMAEVETLRDRLEAGVRDITPEAVIVGAASPRLPNTSCIALSGAQAATLLIRLDLAGIAVSAGSACSSGKIGSSHVLDAMGIDSRLAAGAIRVSLGHTTTSADIGRFLAAWREIHRDVGPRGLDATPHRAFQSEDRRRVKAPGPVGLVAPQAGE